jgi:DNA-binding MarR family transcriptional regulator
MHMTSVVSAWTLLTRDLLDQAAERAGVDLREVSALNLIETQSGHTIDWLGTRVGLTHSGTVRLVDRLEKAGWLTRARAGREVGLGVTPAGRAVLRRWRQAADGAVAAAIGELAPAQAASLVRLLSDSLEGTARRRVEADTTCRTCDWRACGDPCPVDRSVLAVLPPPA